MDAKPGKDGDNIIAHLKGTANVVTEIDKKEKQQCVKFVLANKEENNIKMDVIANEIVAPGHGQFISAQRSTPVQCHNLKFISVL